MRHSRFVVPSVLFNCCPAKESVVRLARVSQKETGTRGATNEGGFFLLVDIKRTSIIGMVLSVVLFDIDLPTGMFRDDPTVSAAFFVAFCHSPRENRQSCHHTQERFPLHFIPIYYWPAQKRVGRQSSGHVLTSVRPGALSPVKIKLFCNTTCRSSTRQMHHATVDVQIPARGDTNVSGLSVSFH